MDSRILTILFSLILFFSISKVGASNVNVDYHREISKLLTSTYNQENSFSSSFFMMPSTNAEGDITQLPINGFVDGFLLMNDSDDEGDMQTIFSAMDSNGNPIFVDGSPNLLASGSFFIILDFGYYYFVAGPSFTGQEQITYEVCDNGVPSSCVTESLVVQVIPDADLNNNNLPIAHDDSNTVESGDQVVTNVVINDVDLDYDPLMLLGVDGLDVSGNPLMVSSVSTTTTTVYDASGTLAGTAYYNIVGQLFFTADASYTGKVPLTYSVSDGMGGVDIGVATITVEEANSTDNDVYANADAFVGFSGVFLSNSLFVNDYDPEGDSFTLAAADGSTGPIPTDGTLTSLGSGGEITLYAFGVFDYTPAANFVGTEVINYTICDNGSPQACEVSSLYLTSFAINSTTAKADFANTIMDTPYSANVLLNDKDAEGDMQFAAIAMAMPAAEGTVSMDADGTYTFDPAVGFVGETDFTYTVCDSGSPQACKTETVTIEILPKQTSAGQAPVANLDRNQITQLLTATGDILSNDFDPDGSDIVVNMINFDSTGDGIPDSNGAVGAPLTIGGIHAEGNAVTNAGTLTILPDGTYTYEPAPSFWGEANINYEIIDENGALDESMLVLEVFPNDGTNTTFVNDDAGVTDREIQLVGNILLNDHDPQQQDQGVTSFYVDSDGGGVNDDVVQFGTPATVYGLQTGGNLVVAGELNILATGEYTFDPAVDFVGNVVATYEACDGSVPESCDEATLNINVVDARRDYGDAPAMYPAAWSRGLEETTGNSIPNGATDIWLGPQADFEASADNSALSDADSFDDAMTVGVNPGDFPEIIDPSTTYDVDIIVNSASPTLVYYGMWIDYDTDGVFDQFYGGSQMTASPAIATVSITTPPTATDGDVVVRLRVDDDPLVMADFEGGKTNGEVEDYQALVALPVELTEFNAKMETCQAILKWTTAEEVDSDKFEIEHSIDGSDFESIGTVKSVGNSNLINDYRFVDFDAKPGFNYYRLKQIDLDGSFKYSEIAVADNECEDHINVTVYPNPTSGKIFVKLKDLNNDTDVASTIILNDMLGRTLQTIPVTETSESTIGIDLSNYTNGMYYIRIQRGKMVYKTHKIMKR